MDRLAQAPLRHGCARRDAACLLLGVVALGWLVPALWPGGFWPAWPAVSLGTLAFVFGLRSSSGGALIRGAACTAGFFALVLGSVQIATLWAFALFAP